MRVLRFALLAAFLPVLICAQVPALWAQTLVSAAPAGDGSDRINIAGRQRMLTQRMAKSICFVLLDVDKVVQRVTAENAALEFDKKLAALQFGSREHALSAESDPEAKRALAQVAETSRTLTISVRQLAAGDLNSAAVRLVIDLNLPTLTQRSFLESPPMGRRLFPHRLLLWVRRG